MMTDLNPDEARAALDRSNKDIARLLAQKKGVAFVGSTKLDARAKAQFARYGDVPIYIVNPRGGGEVQGIPIVESVLDLPAIVDLVVVRVSPKWVAQIVRDCDRHGIRDVLVFTDGYGETDAEGARLERELAQVVANSRVRMIGPNTNDNAFETYPESQNHRGGKIAMITQSGANGRSIVEGVAMGASFHRWVTSGNEVDLEVADFIHYFAGLEEVSVIALYVEGFKSPAKLRVALDRAIRAGKPVVAIKIGATRGGEIAAKSHTGHLTGADAILTGLFRQYGVIRVSDLDELLETANFLSKMPVSTGSNCVMYTISGGTAALMAETADAAGLSFPQLPQDVQDKLHQYIPANVSVRNPIDNGGVFVMSSEQSDRLAVIDLATRDPSVDILLFGFNAAYGPLSDRMAADALAWAPTANKPTVAVWASTLTDTQGYRDLVASGVPIFRSFTKCMRAIALRRQWLAVRRAYSRVSHWPARTLSPQARTILAKPGVVSASNADFLLDEFGISRAREVIAASPHDAARAAAELGWPVVLKLASSEIPHKSDQGFVQLGLPDEESVEMHGRAMFENAARLGDSVKVDGLIVQEQVAAGVEMLVGLTVDPALGLALTVGMGGLYAEVTRDTVSAPLPVNELDVRGMIGSLRMMPLLGGVRGQPAVDMDALVALILRVAEFGEAADGMLAELDLNPVIALPDGAVAVDCLIVAAGEPEVSETRQTAPEASIAS